jgi:hypothetical protein
MSLRLIPPGEMDVILLVVGHGLVGEREDMLLVVTPGLDITFGSAAFWDGSASTTSTTSDLDFLCGTPCVRQRKCSIIYG